MYDNEARIVLHQEQPDDIAVRELGRARAACVCRLQFGRCKRRECKHCARDRRFKECYNQLNDYNKERLGAYISEYYQVELQNPNVWKSFSFLIKETIAILFVIAIFIFVPFILYLLMDPQDKPSSRIPADVANKITYCLMYSQRCVYDRNLDQKVNCFDYAVTFKEQWDDMFPAYRNKCKLVRNKTARMNHLFAVVYFDGGSVCVETWAEDYRQWHMEDNWDSRYNPKYNIYNETDRWMKEVKW